MDRTWDIVDDASARARRHLESVRDGPVVPAADAVDGLAGITDDLPDGPTDPAAVLAELDRVGSPAAVRQSGGRYFGFVNGGIEPAGLGAAVLALAWDQNAALPVMSPIAARLDGIAARWVVDLLGLPPTATFCAGATVANLTSIVTARDTLLRQAGWETAADGLVGAPPIRIVASAEIHTSVLKSLRLAGLGTGSVLPLPTDSCGRVVAAELPPIDGPTLVLLQAGNVNTGHSDPFREVVERLGADRDRTWVHVDGAFGLWANASPARRHLLDGVELADSWATDGHKWLNTPYDCGVAVVARGDELVESMRMDAAYARGDDGSDRSPMNMGVQMSQAARAVPVWAVLASLGRAGVAEMVERCCRHAERFAELLAAGGAEVLVPPVLNQVLVAFGDDETTDAVIERVQRSEVCWMGGTTWHGRRAMRISVSDTATTDDDVEVSAAAVLAALSAVGS